MRTNRVKGLSVSRKLYQFLTLAYPRKYRLAYGPWMVQLFCDQYRDTVAASLPGGLVSFWLHALLDLAGSVLKEQVEQFRRVMMGENSSNPLDPGDRRHRVISRVLMGLALFFLVPVAFLFYVTLFRGGLSIFLGSFILAALLSAAFVLYRSLRGTAARSRDLRVAMIAGGLMLAALGVLAASLVAPQVVIPYPIPDWVNTAMTVAFFLLPAIVVFYAALSLYLGLRLILEGRSPGSKDGGGILDERRPVGKMSAGFFILSALLLGLLLFDLYWLAVWDSTNDPLEFFWLISPVLTAVFAGVLTASLLSWNVKWAGLCYALLVPALVVGVFYSGKQIDFRQLTESRGAKITQAVEAYFIHEGRYPEQLGQLTPWYLVSIPSPVIIQGANWCYQGGADYFRLGYLDRDHWSSPILFGRVVSTNGHSPLKVDVCQQAIDFLRERYDWDTVLMEYGRPTPTPDLGQ